MAYCIQQAERANVWPRSFNVMTCSKFCPYGKLCMSEFVSGKVNQTMRDEYYMLDDGYREGAQHWEAGDD